MTDMTRREALKGAASLAVGLPVASALAFDAQGATKKLKVVVAGAHPDDPESASGGLMVLYAKAGHEVVSLYLTRGEAGVPGKSHEEAARIRTEEAEAACRILGSRPVFAGQVDGSTEVNRARYDELKRVLDEEKPDLVVTHWPIDTHRDHRAISLLVYDAWLHSGKSFELYYFETESGEQTQHFWPTHYVEITQVEGKNAKPVTRTRVRIRRKVSTRSTMRCTDSAAMRPASASRRLTSGTIRPLPDRSLGVGTRGFERFVF
jgi:LmbE family N-acetylglucosaminyl deacetylase